MKKNWPLLVIALAVGAGAGSAAASFYWNYNAPHSQSQFLAASCTNGVPHIFGRVTDNADILSTGTERRITKQSEEIELQTGHQVAIITLPVLPDHIDKVGPQIANCWGLGRKGYNDGILVTIAPNERKVRIDVGNGLMPKLTNGEAANIINSIMLPAFRSGDFDRGAGAAMNAITKEIG